ncbi:MAG: hypothetical protein HY548_09385 [Elusimicrobia bacterium]|nr:hypothetical protein [Elusimicrobiota bacterium]
MSTRCQLAVYATPDKPVQSAALFVYKHFDGFPEGEGGMLGHVLPFLRWFQKERGLKDVAYATARLIQHLANRSDRGKEPKPGKGWGPQIGCKDALGVGVNTFLCDDIRYFYHISPKEVKVYDAMCEDNVRRQPGLPGGWKLIATYPISETQVQEVKK